MSAKQVDIVKQIEALEGEQASIEAKSIHEGFRDASRRNRVEEQLTLLRDTLRRGGLTGHDIQGNHDASSPTPKRSSSGQK